MELLPEGKKNQTNVSYKDQQLINEFSKLIMRKDSIEEQLNLQNEEKSYLEDVSLEIELIDEDQLVHYKIGDVFLMLPQEEVVNLLESDTEVIDSKIDNLQNSKSEIDDRLKELKAQLYAKFGDNINLER
ncbi:hypothetical protein Kpol_1039p61 [Vanderwaltozyma polyspora DSM 70294]|uniref:Prefoldin subunit 4 n=1 Tax=Vanderwaltozyma polyspora (strain ATCC 22028 / DSM 70294 / BCRC 21397 / CBS 2163 / NBRC 10782 / NRRL Y-8283 / UCD 57-17) TaxID=436907 RepID=A7THI6_VANPO|nr:uncharacterized protein Kpol_1039p61 [Vanderwaltozyma polyspora DSM 70294]EDO18310.1 hypothetical protein Kpol_1039p61 [Vanderwaltozyma polyspora DSM 70294]